MPSSYEYDDDFTSDEDESEAASVKTAGNSQHGGMDATRRGRRPKEMSAASDRTVTSTTSGGSVGSLSRIPIKRNSSMRRKKEIMDNYTSPTKFVADKEAPGPPPLKVSNASSSAEDSKGNNR